MRIGAHAAMAGRRQCGEFLAKLSSLLEQFLGLIALHPVFELFKVFRLLEIRNRNLMCAPSAFDWLAIDEFRPGPALGGAENDHRPAPTLQASRLRLGPGGALDVTNLKQNPIESSGKSLMHQCGIFTLDKMRVVAVTSQKLRQFLAADAGQHRRI